MAGKKLKAGMTTRAAKTTLPTVWGFAIAKEGSGICHLFFSSNRIPPIEKT